jgi:ribosomal protein L7/L12
MQTYNIKYLKVCRELHSLQVNDLIAILCSSASRQQLPHSQQQHAQQPQATHAQQHKTHEKGETNCDCSSGKHTHKMKRLKACRELHSLQGNDLISSLCLSASCQQLPNSQQQHAQHPQATHAQQHKTHEKGETNCDCSSGKHTHKIKRLKACRELHSLQSNDSIASLCSSASCQKLLHTQQQHAQQPQATDAQHLKTCNKRGNKQQLQQQHANSQV